MLQLQAKNAIVTGARRGIGKSIICAFAQSGVNIWACTRKQDSEFETWLRTLEEKYNIWAKAVYFDLANSSAVKEAINGIIKEKTQIDILVNNAGIVNTSLFQMTSLDTIREVYSINVFAAMQITQMVLRSMSKVKSGCIINMASVSGLDVNVTNCTYGSSKAALISFTKSLAAETAPLGIRVNAIAPGPTETDMMNTVKDKLGESVFSRLAMKRFATPDEIADVVLFLASDKASFINGEVIRVDGGQC